MNIYVGNLSYNTTEDDLRTQFETYGQVTSARVVIDKMTNRSKGFGFVEMGSQSEGQAAISGLNGKDLGGRALNVNEARPKTEGFGGGGGGRSGGGYGGGGRSRY
ncbi:MAG: RNA-binding protein [Candidatus Hydrogenedentes bacterium]|nr:RNA-binding protein [Candidatus Hydrogenedentota bacterium]